MNKPRQFWINRIENGNGYSDWYIIDRPAYGFIHVIEYAAYQKVIRALKKIKFQSLITPETGPLLAIASDVLKELGEIDE